MPYIHAPKYHFCLSWCCNLTRFDVNYIIFVVFYIIFIQACTKQHENIFISKSCFTKTFKISWVICERNGLWWKIKLKSIETCVVRTCWNCNYESISTSTNSILLKKRKAILKLTCIKYNAYCICLSTTCQAANHYFTCYYMQIVYLYMTATISWTTTCQAANHYFTCYYVAHCVSLLVSYDFMNYQLHCCNEYAYWRRVVLCHLSHMNASQNAYSWCIWLHVVGMTSSCCFNCQNY